MSDGCASKPAAPRPYVRPWADDDDDDAGRHGDDAARSRDVTARQPFNVVSSNLINTLPSICPATPAGMYTHAICLHAILSSFLSSSTVSLEHDGTVKMAPLLVPSVSDRQTVAQLLRFRSSNQLRFYLRK